MEMKSAERLNGDYFLHFEEEIEGIRRTIIIRFCIYWSLVDSENKQPISNVFIVEKTLAFPIKEEELLTVLPVHIPQAYSRFFFKTCMEFFIRETGAPASLANVNHPGYPLTAITFNHHVLKPAVLQQAVATIINAIQNADIKIEQLQEEKSDEKEEDQDILDGDLEDVPIIDYDFEDALKKQLNIPDKLNTTSLIYEEEEDD